jgi:hypothetical protein
MAVSNTECDRATAKQGISTQSPREEKLHSQESPGSYYSPCASVGTSKSRSNSILPIPSPPAPHQPVALSPAAPSLPTSEDYKSTTVSDMKDELTHRGVVFKSQQLKRDFVALLRAEDQAGNLGRGVFRDTNRRIGRWIKS